MERFDERDLLLISIPIVGIAILLEWFISIYRNRKVYSFKETTTNIYMSLLFAGIDSVLRNIYVLPLLYFFLSQSFFVWPKTWLYWISVFLITDFMYFLLHWVDHKVRPLWAVHVTHHSSIDFNVSTGFRSPVFQPFYRVIFFAPVAWMGFDPIDIILVYGVGQIYGALIHTQLVRSLGILEHVLVTPSHHRVHHASNKEYLDKNMGMFLIVWDKMFGTFKKEEGSIPLKFGITHEIQDRGPFNILFHEWKAILQDLKDAPRSFREKLRAFFSMP
jgi:sterol desaturase/sphingolipid hydroxylase (fatty acid hydroxylase superfamily)